MPHLDIVDDADVTVTDSLLIEGFPGIGLVGKIAADHLVDEFGMSHYANVHCESLPKVAVYGESDATLRTPVRVYADGDRDLIVLRSDAPVGPASAWEIADCLAEWYDETGITPVYLSGIATEKDESVPSMYGVATGEGASLLSAAGVDDPTETGVVSGPTGALLSAAIEADRTAVGLIVESDPRFPDPEAARVLIKHGVEPLADISVPVDDLVDHAEEIRQARKHLAKQMQQADEESTRARPLQMYQ